MLVQELLNTRVFAVHDCELDCINCVIQVLHYKTLVQVNEHDVHADYTNSNHTATSQIDLLFTY